MFAVRLSALGGRRAATDRANHEGAAYGLRLFRAWAPIGYQGTSKYLIYFALFAAHTEASIARAKRLLRICSSMRAVYPAAYAAGRVFAAAIDA